VIKGDILDLGLKGKTALVTAASRGFGEAVAMQLAAEGAKVAMCARGEEALMATAENVRAVGQSAWGGSGGQVFAQPCDVTDGEAVAGFMAEAENQLGPLDLMLVNAGGPPAGTFADFDLSQWEAAYRLTIESAVRLCQMALPGMQERGWGRIVQITSISVLEPVDNLLLSSVLRPAVQGLTRTLANECASAGVTVNSVAPGFHTTSAVERIITRKMADTGCTRKDVIGQWTEAIPVGRLGEASELASLVLFLMSEQAAYITGQCIVADGGWVKRTI
jgi:3-oxoacyl-[acyl-carrier protein] reductase